MKILMLLPLAALSVGCASVPHVEPLPVSTGQRARLSATTLPEGRHEGTVLGIQSGALLMELGPSGRIQVPVDSLTSFAVRTGTKGHAGVGALIGLGVGAAGFALADSDGESTNNDYRSGGAIILPIAGALAGALLGALIRAPQWQEQPIPPLVTNALHPVVGQVLWSIPIGIREPGERR
jgi:hypothetical protein